MTRSIDSAAFSSVLVGRSLEIERLDVAIENVVVGDGTTVLVSGEAGIGKSRLITEAKERLGHRSPLAVPIIQGNCYEVDRNVPCAPLIELLEQSAVYRREPTSESIADLLRTWFRSEAMSEPAEGRRRLLQALRDAVSSLSEPGQPVLVVLEDLHWSDEVTLEMVPSLSRSLTGSPTLLLMTYRDEEVTPALRHMLATLDRERMATELSLRQLRRGDIDQMLRAMFKQAHPIRADFLDMIHKLTDGNPFFIEETIRSLIASGDIYFADGHWRRKETSELRIPRSVQDAVLSRTAGLTTTSREVLSLAAVTGRHFGFKVIQKLTGLDETALLGCIRELIENQLIDEETGDQFSFRHALTREAIYAELLLRERQRLHLDVAHAIEHLGPEAVDYRVSDLAYHYGEARVWDKTYEYAVNAGNRALSLFAPRAAVNHFSNALNAAGALSIEMDPDLYRKRGQAYATLGEFDLAQRDFEVLLSIVREKDERDLEWKARIDLGELWTGRDYDRSRAYFQQAFDLASEMNEPTLIARSLLKLGNWQVNAEQVDEAEESLSRALAIFEQRGDQAGIAEALDLLGVVADVSGDLRRMRERYEQAISRYQAVDDRKGVVSAKANIAATGGGYILFEPISLAGGVSAADAESTGENVVKLARQIDWYSGEAYAMLTLALHHRGQGDYGRAMDLGFRSLEIAGQIDHQEWIIVGQILLGCLYSDLLDLQRAGEHFDRASSLARDSRTILWQRTTTAQIGSNLIDQGRFDEAQQVLREVDDRLSMNTIGLRMLWFARARLALAVGDGVTALEIIDRLFATARNCSGEEDVPALAKLRAECLLALGRYDEAEITLNNAQTGAVTYGLRPLLWRVHLSRGELCQATDRTDAAAIEYAHAREIVEGLAASVQDELLRDHFHPSAMAMIPQGRPSRGELTPRERDVAELVAKGLSNREIADQLFIGERTVETHVGNILAKLDFSSRLQIAAWIIESGLDDAAR